MFHRSLEIVSSTRFSHISLILIFNTNIVNMTCFLFFYTANVEVNKLLSNSNCASLGKSDLLISRNGVIIIWLSICFVYNEYIITIVAVLFLSNVITIT